LGKKKKKSAISISLSFSSHCRRGKQFNPMEITFIVFPAKEEVPQSLANSHSISGASRTYSKSAWFCSNPRWMFLTIRVAIDVK
jgi:hypothetical protein